MYIPFHKVILRTPLKPLNFLEDFLSNGNDSDTDIQSLLKTDKIIKEAFYLASPNLSSKIRKWVNKEITDKKEIEKIKISIYKYISRLSSRSTPFGLFAGITVCKLSEKTEITFNNQSDYKRNLRLDMNYLVSLALELSKVPEIKNQLKYYPNTSLYKVRNKIRYIEYTYYKSKRVHHIAAVDDSEYLNNVIQEAEKGATIEQLTSTVLDHEITYKEAEAFIHELIDSQILLSELEPSVTGDDFLEQIIHVLSAMKNIDEYKTKLNHIRRLLFQLNEQALGIEIEAYNNLSNQLKNLYPEFDINYLYQADMLKPAVNCTVDKKVKEQISEGLHILNSLSIKAAETNLTKFQNAFYERYEDEEIPLMTALDTEIGIGYLQNNYISGVSSPLVDDLVISNKAQRNRQLPWNSIYSLLLNKQQNAIKTNKTVIELTDEELKPIQKNETYDDLPPTVYTMVQIFKNENKEMIYMKNAGGSSAINLIGRFAHIDKGIQDLIFEIIEHDEHTKPDSLFAEIVHLPESRTGNVLLRPTIRKYEIPYLAKASVKKNYKIDPKDLMISVKGGRILLRSKKHNKEVIPRLGNAHNYSYNALPVYHFLCDMQTQNLRGGIGFSWGPLEQEFDFLPRVTYKNIILSFAKWNVKKNELKTMLKIKDDRQLLREVKLWREKRNIPVWTALEDGDNKLTLNLENILCVKTLISLVKNRQSFVLSEYILNNENAFIKDKNGYYANEFIFALKKE